MPPASRVPPLVAPGAELSGEQVGRWSRNILLPELGSDGQRRLQHARVCVVGAGGLGAPVLLYLAAAGVGRIGVVDADHVDVTNLQRQVVHGSGDVGRRKVDSARDAVLAIDPGIEVVVHDVRLTEANVDEVLAGYDLVVDGTDNFPTRYLVNDACVRLGLPEVWGSVYRFDAQVSVFWGRPPGGSGVAAVQLRDLFPAPPPAGSVPSCAEGGVLGALCGQVGSVMATEAIKLITGVGDPLLGRVLVLDALSARWAEVPLVAAGPASWSGAGTVASEPAWAPAASPSPATAAVPAVTATELAARLQDGGSGPGRDVVLVDVREPAERALVEIPGSAPVPFATILDGSALAGPAPVVPRDVPVVVYCHSGHRSELAARALRAAGYDDVANLTGGVLAWVADVDPSLPTY